MLFPARPDSRSWIASWSALSCGALALAPTLAAQEDDPLSGLPPANAGAFEGGPTGTLEDAGINEPPQKDNGGFDNVSVILAKVKAPFEARSAQGFWARTRALFARMFGAG